MSPRSRYSQLYVQSTCRLCVYVCTCVYTGYSPVASVFAALLGHDSFLYARQDTYTCTWRYIYTLCMCYISSRACRNVSCPSSAAAIEREDIYTMTHFCMHVKIYITHALRCCNRFSGCQRVFLSSFWWRPFILLFFILLLLIVYYTSLLQSILPIANALVLLFLVTTIQHVHTTHTHNTYTQHIQRCCNRFCRLQTRSLCSFWWRPFTRWSRRCFSTNTTMFSLGNSPRLSTLCFKVCTHM